MERSVEHMLALIIIAERQVGWTILGFEDPKIWELHNAKWNLLLGLKWCRQCRNMFKEFSQTVPLLQSHSCLYL